jgi:hypothetical protein
MVQLVMENGSWGPELLEVWDLLNRSSAISALSHLNMSLSPSRKIDETLSNIAIGFDTNALFRLGNGRSGADVLDFLRTQHHSPIIVAGQTLQELWNNQLAGLTPLSKSLRSKFEELETEALKIDHRFGQSGVEVKSAIEALSEEFSATFDDAAQESFRSTLEVLDGRAAIVSYVPRFEFYKLAQVRHETKTPPGFKDDRMGDFFVWADFLYGLCQCEKESLEAVVFVTHDRKTDWSREGFAHPILSAEVEAITPVPFELWTVPQLTEYVRSRPSAVVV